MTEEKLLRKIRYELSKEHMRVKTIKDCYGGAAYLIVDANNVIQTAEQGMYLDELAHFAGVKI